MINNYKELIGDITARNGGFIKLPVDLKILEDYLSDFIIEYIGFKSPLKGIDGYWEFENNDQEKIIIYYNIDRPLVAQRFIKAHELFHVIQLLDSDIRNDIDFLKYQTIMPSEIIQKLIDRSADKGASMFLMPNNYVINKYKEVKDIKQAADIFQVSREAMFWRLKECGVTLQ